MTPEERTALERARVATLATADDEGRPHAVPICYALLELETETASSDTPTHRIVSAIDEKPKSSRRLQRVRDVRTNPRATVLVHHYSEDWSRLAWVQVRGRARVRPSEPSESAEAAEPTGGVARDEAVDALESKYDQYAGHDLDERPILEIRVDRTLSWGALAEYGYRR